MVLLWSRSEEGQGQKRMVLMIYKREGSTEDLSFFYF